MSAERRRSDREFMASTMPEPFDLGRTTQRRKPRPVDMPAISREAARYLSERSYDEPFAAELAAAARAGLHAESEHEDAYLKYSSGRPLRFGPGTQR